MTERSVIDLARRLAARRSDGVRIGIGDDCAVLAVEPGTMLLVTTDLLIEDVHFRRRYAEPADIGWKALAVNLSDIASMGGRPRWVTIALACPEETAAGEIEAFYEGLFALAHEHDVALVGGDTAAAPHGWLVNVTALGESAHPILRSTAREQDVIVVTGPLGRSAAGLAVLEHGAPSGVPADALADVTSAHLRPIPRVREGRWLGDSGAVTSMIDVSDGLATDLAHLAEESGVGARVELTRVPVSESTRTVAAALDRDPIAWATGGGEDYELLFTCAASAFTSLAAALERTSGGTRLHAIGEIVDGGPGVTFLDAAGREVAVGPGYQHFHRRRRARDSR